MLVALFASMQQSLVLSLLIVDTFAYQIDLLSKTILEGEVHFVVNTIVFIVGKRGDVHFMAKIGGVLFVMLFMRKAIELIGEVLFLIKESLLFVGEMHFVEVILLFLGEEHFVEAIVVMEISATPTSPTTR